MMDARAPGDGRITISLPIFVSVVPIEKRKGSYNRESTIEWIEEAFKKAGWKPQPWASWTACGHHPQRVPPSAFRAVKTRPGGVAGW
jgi:hypothetical protein